MDSALITADQYFIYFSQIMGHPVMDCNGERVGRFYDFSMALGNDIYPRAKGVIIKRGLVFGQYAEVPIADVLKINAKTYLKIPGSAVQFQKTKVDCEFGLRRDVLDQQVVDVQNRKVVRVNDVHLLRADNQYHIAHVDVGLRALIRRLDWEPVVDALVRLFRPQADYLTAQELVSWKNSQVLTIGNQKNVLRLDVARAKIAKIPPTALADIMGDLDVFEQVSLFRTLPFDVQLKVFTDMTADDKAGLFEQLDDKEAALIVTKIPSDEAADFLMSIPKDRMQQLLRVMETQTSKRLRALLGFRKDSAGGLMATEYLSLSQRATVGDAINMVKSNVDHSGSITTIFVVDDVGKYLGTTTIRRFINEDVNRPILDTCHPHKLFVRTDDGMEKIAVLLEQYKYSAIPVLDDNNILVGAITVDDVMEELIAIAWGKYKDQL